MNKTTTIALLLTLLTLAGPVLASDNPALDACRRGDILPIELPPAMEQAASPGAAGGAALKQNAGSAEALLGFAQYDGDYWLALGIGATFKIKAAKLKVGVQIPLKFRVYDQEPKSDSPWYYREEDWDEFSDWLKIIRFVQYAEERDPFYARLGEFGGSNIGHGTILGRYYNNLELDHFHIGLDTKVNLDEGGGEFLVNDMLVWNLVGIRGYFRPFQVFLKDKAPAITKKLAFGMSFITDYRAPNIPKLAVDPSDPSKFVYATDKFDIQEFHREVAWMYGFDIELEVYKSEHILVLPYLDINTMRFETGGSHLGLLNNFLFLGTKLELRTEYRMMGKRYSPVYFNALYDLERVSFLPIGGLSNLAVDGGTGAAATADLTGPVVPKYHYLMKANDWMDADLKFRHGLYGELFWLIGEKFGIGGSYEDYQGAFNTSWMLRAHIIKLFDAISASAYLTRRNFDGLGDVDSLDRAFLIAEARWYFSKPFFLYGQFQRYWQLVDDPDADAGKGYETADTYNVGVGVSFTF